MCDEMQLQCDSFKMLQCSDMAAWNHLHFLRVGENDVQLMLFRSSLRCRRVRCLAHLAKVVEQKAAVLEKRHL